MQYKTQSKRYETVCVDFDAFLTLLCNTCGTSSLPAATRGLNICQCHIRTKSNAWHLFFISKRNIRRIYAAYDTFLYRLIHMMALMLTYSGWWVCCALITRLYLYNIRTGVYDDFHWLNNTEPVGYFA